MMDGYSSPKLGSLGGSGEKPAQLVIGAKGRVWDLRLMAA